MAGHRREKRNIRALWRRENSWILIIVALALVLRVVYLLQVRGHLFFNNYGDSLIYHWWAQSIIQGSPGPPVFYMSPLYPYLLAIFYGIFGPHPEVVLWFQVLLGASSCGLIYLLGQMTFGRSVGLLAALMGALYAVEIFYEGMLLMATVLYAINLLLLVSIYFAQRRKKWLLWIVPGLFLGISAVGRASVLAFLPLLILGIFLLSRARWQKSVRQSAAVLLGVFLVLAPVALHNVVVGNDLVLITSNLGLNFFVGNNPDAPGHYDQPKGLESSMDMDGSKIAMAFMGKRLKHSEVSRFWFQKGLDFVKTQPRVFLRLTLDKVLFFWNAYEIPQVEHLDFFKRFAPLLRLPLLRFAILGPLGLLGLALSLGRWRQVYFALGFFVALMVATILFFVISRIRLQVCSVLMIFAAYALVWLWERLRARRIWQLGLAVLALAGLALLVNRPHPALNVARDMAKSRNYLANSLAREGNLQQAFREFSETAVAYPQLGLTYINLANLYFMQNRNDKGMELLKKALQADPQVSAAHLIMGNFYAKQGKWDQAIVEYRAEIKSSPYSLMAHTAFARAMKEKKKLESESGAESDFSQP
ncbi:MAG: hypothetical protein AMJ92_03660 [candidate division Zixibacteria bacterium SM23_81]|nr:MAG: hypothetical protein AMJ92_03660 [candidate division Zixibacteria bacterium SM23_81]